MNERKGFIIPVLALFSPILAAVTATAAFEDDPGKYWNIDELASVPASRPAPFPESRYPGLKALLVSGRGPNGSSAEFFCYYGTPEGPVPAGGWPGVVMVHGGSGTAFPNFALDWIKLGVAVIAPDWYNQRPAPGLTNAPPTEITVPRVDLPGGRRQDHVANVANMVLSHSLLRSFPEIDRNRTFFAGLSWGSWYGVCVAAVDGRFKGCLEIYCGDKNASPDLKDIMKLVNGRFLHAARVPMWWIVSTNDRNVTPETSAAGFAATPTFLGATVVNNLAHGHGGYQFDSVRRMVRHFAGLAKPLPRLGKPTVSGNRVSAAILDPGEGHLTGRLGYTCSEDPVSWRREWKYAPATIRDGVISAELPAGTRQCYLAAYECEARRNDMCGTTTYVFVDDGVRRDIPAQ